MLNITRLILFSLLAIACSPKEQSTYTSVIPEVNEPFAAAPKPPEKLNWKFTNFETNKETKGEFEHFGDDQKFRQLVNSTAKNLLANSNSGGRFEYSALMSPSMPMTESLIVSRDGQLTARDTFLCGNHVKKQRYDLETKGFLEEQWWIDGSAKFYENYDPENELVVRKVYYGGGGLARVTTTNFEQKTVKDFFYTYQGEVIAKGESGESGLVTGSKLENPYIFETFVSIDPNMRNYSNEVRSLGIIHSDKEPTTYFYRNSAKELEAWEFMERSLENLCERANET